MSKSGGVFQIDDVTRTMSKGGVRLVFHPSKFRPPPHLAGWLRACAGTVSFYRFIHNINKIHKIHIRYISIYIRLGSIKIP